MKMYLRTPYCTQYVVDLETGNITQDRYGIEPQFSGQWKFVAFQHVKRNEWVSLKSIQNNPKVLDEITLKYKNGHPQWTVVDLDHGTTRVWGNTQVHGISSIRLEEMK